MRKIMKIWLIAVSLLVVYQPANALSKKKIKRINNSLIFDLFMNYEFTEKNRNLSTIIDFFPDSDCWKFSKIVVESNAGGNSGICTFNYDKKGSITKAAYQVRRRIFTYEFFYNKKKPDYVNIAGKKKIVFKYNKKGMLTSITRTVRDMEFEYNFSYNEVERKFDIKLVVVRDGKRRPSHSKYHATLNNDFKLKGFRLDIYVTDNMKYTGKGDILSSSFASVNKDDNVSEWKYEKFDKKGNWLERNFLKELKFTRVIEYN